MSAYDKKTIKIKGNSSTGVFLDANATGIAASSGYVSAIPDLWYDDSYQIVIECYEDYTSTSLHDFGTSSPVAKLYIKLRNSVSQEHLLSTGTITQSGGTGKYYIVTFNFVSGLIPDYLAGQDCILYAEMTTNTEQTTFVQYLKVLDERGDLSFDQRYDTGDISVDVQILDTTQDLTAYPGVIRYLVDTTNGDVSLTLPEFDDYPVQYIEIQQINHSGNTVRISPEINGTSGHTLTQDDFIAIVGAGDTPAWFKLQYEYIN